MIKYSLVIKVFIPLRYVLVLLTVIFSLKSTGQCFDEKTLSNIDKIELDSVLSTRQKLTALYTIKRKADSCKANENSIYIRVLIDISSYELGLKNYSTALFYALQAVSLSNSEQQKIPKILRVKSYSLLAHYYDQALLLNKALAYYDTTITIANFPAAVKYILDSRLYKAYIYFRIGDFQKGVEESTLGLDLALINKDSISYLRLVNQRMQSFFYQNKLKNAETDVNNAIQLAEKLQQAFQLATAYKTKALIAARLQDFTAAEVFFIRSIKERNSTKRFEVVASDYNDFGNFYRDSLHAYSKALNCYSKAISYALKTADSAYLGMIYINLTKTYFYENNYREIERSYLQQMKYLKLFSGNNLLFNPAAKDINLIGNKHVIIEMLQDKTEILLQAYKKNNQKKFLAATIATALLTDSVITQTQYEQSGEQSKLFWRNKTREFYRNSIEACYLKNTPGLAFFFFEKSRAVLLNEQLHQLEAMSLLPMQEAESQEKFQIDIIEQEQKLSLLSPSSPVFAAQQIKLLRAKENFENYIKTIEQKYPAYYQYKFALQIPSLQNLQQQLAKNNQSFVHYFIDDTVMYILSITGTDTKFIRLPQKEFDKEMLSQFLQFCANKQKLNNHYNSFASLSNSIYKEIFQLLSLPKGRTIICSDNIVIPFEALCTDADGKHFLINDYSFSYVYSARFLMKKVENITASGNFIGFAPVSFRDNLHVAELKNADEAMHAAASYYKNDKLLTHENASRSNFFRYAPSYSIVSIFSHAFADTTDNEPKLYMQDSLIYLSELQRLNNPAIRLVLLSACQTNVGRAATGEGIYSLARGFATAGIPSVAATLWKADEQTIYAISEKFNEYLSEGMTKDEALQKAKLYFVQNKSNNEKLLPYYWANMILIGNAEAIKLSPANNNYWWWIPVSLAILLSLFFILRINRRKKKQVN